MTSLPIINQGRSYYAGQDEIASLDARLALSSGQIYKALVPPSSIVLPSLTWTILASTDTVSVLSDDFTSEDPGELLYTGEGGYYQIYYSLSALMTITSPDVIFSIFINSVDSIANVQFIQLTQAYKNVSSSAIVLLATNDVISIRAQTQGANDSIEVQNIVVNANRILQ